MVEFAALPILEAIGPLKAALAVHNVALLVAPPGAGKTTVVPLALMDEPWASGRRILMLEPRRVAARAAATRMASTLSEAVGERVGFRVRMDSRISARTRIEVITEGVFTRMIQDDPLLDGVAAVIFDEFHERSLDADLGLALARDAQSVLRDDLRLLVMSATLDGTRVAALLGDAPVIESLGRSHPVATVYLGRDPALQIEMQAARAVRRALAENDGGVLVFLPGQGEIRRTEDALGGLLPPNVFVAPLYGALSPAEQDRAIATPPLGLRKVVLATAIAQTSLTLADVRVVIDCGLSRVPRYDPSSGLTSLETVRVSLAAADQRRGRAGRTAPGFCYRLWDEAETRALTLFDRPEILDADLSGLALDLALWGARSAEGLAFLDPPPATAWREARGLLTDLGALTAEGDLTLHGRALARLPLPPRLAQMVVEGVSSGSGRKAALMAAVIGERGLGGASADLVDRLTSLSRDRSDRAQQARKLAGRWADLAGAARADAIEASVGRLLLAAYPERIAKRRGGPGEFRLASGRGVFIDATDALAREDWLVVAELGGGGVRDRILLAAAIQEAEVLEAYGRQLAVDTTVSFDTAGRASAKRTMRLGRILVKEEVVPASPGMIRHALTGRLAVDGLAALPWGPATLSFRARIAFLRALDGEGWPDLSDEELLARTDDWAPAALEGARSLAAVSPSVLDAAIRALVPWDLQRRLDQLAPARFTAPTGESFAIDYEAQGGPTVEVRVQNLFGLTDHPTVAGGRVPLTLALTSPAHRPVQVTKDLPGFWRGSWSAVRSEMRGRYPKHPWPEDPLTAAPTNRAKPRGT